ncbi:GNAT family N-acetyltransferase [Cellulomonas sp. URHE0023]|uniref:bifunctional acetate--CoA ligase family protein/GNAT family N-acetyltransferase n=1 Tax=Cellulomonas sp. URHE0023 TaxID=1380354 RepID=UPI0004808E99|nr:GNAT family N-acetyltransferase [Cellulomonas sp. URHE0023]
MADVADDAPAYPAGWEADVVLHDGSTTRIRPMLPTDADALQAFHVAQSERSTYLRFFAALERLSDRELQRLVVVDHVDRVALVAVADVGGTEQIIGVARYDRIDDDDAEVAFNVADAHQGRGLGSVLLEHLSAAARERGVRRFVAEVLPQNGRMIAVFREAGYVVRQRTEDGIVALSFDIDPTDRSLAVMADREHRAEARSVRQLLEARSVVVVGPGADDATLVGRLAAAVLGDLRAGDPDLVIQAVSVPGAAALSLVDVLGPVELAIVAVPPDAAAGVVRDLAPLGVRGVVLLSTGFAEDGPEGLERQRELLRVAHGSGMRIVGPGSYGLLAYRGGSLLNASLAQVPPIEGRIGLFCQSAPMAVALLAAARRRGIGLSEFVSAGHRADVSGNDLMQFWADDDGTDVVGLYLESIGNPRKFTRVARRLSQLKPVVVVTAGRSGQVVPPGHAVRATHAPPRTLAEMLRQAGVVRVDNTHQLLDVAQVLAHQPLPSGRRTSILASSAATAALVAEAATSAGLVATGRVVLLPEDAPADQVRLAIAELYDDPEGDVVVAVRIPTVGGPDPVLQAEISTAAARTGRTTVVCMDELHGVTAELTAVDDAGRTWTVPAYSTPEDGVLALGRAARYAQWRSVDRGLPLHPSDADTRTARSLVAGWLTQDGNVVALDPARVAALLATVGIEVVPSHGVHDADEAVAAAERIGWPVALKTTVSALRHRADLGGVRLDIADEVELRADVREVLQLAEAFDSPTDRPPLEVQAMAPHGSACVVRSVEDPLFGPIISFGLAGDASELLGDVAYGVPPLTDVDVAELVRSARAAPRLFGYRGLPVLDVGALEDLIARVAVLADDLPELRSLELNPVVVSERGAVVLGARASVARADRADGTRRLSST